MGALTKRIATLEQEYSLHYQPRHDEKLEGVKTEELCRELFWSVTKNRRLRILDVFLENGARFYLDFGNHPEFAGPETLIRDALIYVRAGESIMLNACDSVQKDYEGSGFGGTVFLHKIPYSMILSGQEGETYVGSHENYLGNRCMSSREYGRTLLPFLATRHIFTGGGKPNLDGSFDMLARAEAINEEFSNNTTGYDRALINMRTFLNSKENHAGEEFRRIHLICGDHLMCPVSEYLRLATTVAALSLAEIGVIPVDLKAGESLGILKRVSSDLTLKQKYDAGGENLTAIEIQRRFLDAFDRTFPKAAEQLEDPSLEHLVSEWDNILSLLSIENVEERNQKLFGLLDWVTIYMFSSRGYDNGESYKKIGQIYLDFHQIYPKGQLFDKLVQKGRVRINFLNGTPIFTEEEIDSAMHSPPANTRAKARGEQISRAGENPNQISVHWERIILYREDSPTVYHFYADPRDSLCRISELPPESLSPEHSPINI